MRLEPACVFSLAAVLSASAAETPAPAAILERPALVYHPGDRAVVLKRLGAVDRPWVPEKDDADGKNVVSALLASYHFAPNARRDLEGWGEEARSERLFHLALLAWIHPAGKFPDGTAYLDGVRAAVRKLSVPAGRVRDFLTEKGGDPNKAGPWARFLDSGVFLWRYALAYDLLASKEVRAAGLEDAVLDELYAKLADGALHVLVDHLRSNAAWQGWGKTRPVGNNWNARELSGVGMALLALRDRLEKEPADSARGKDLREGLDLTRAHLKEFLESWGSPDRGDGAYCYYYEGPHYLRYWVEYALALGAAWTRAFPKDGLDLLAAGGPMARFCRAHTLTILPTRREGAAAVWSCAPIDDTWTYPDEAYIPVLLAAAWIDGSAADRALFREASARAGGRVHELLLAHPLLEELASGPLPERPQVEAIPHDGLAVARAGPDAAGLTVIAKNAITPQDKNGVSLWNHAHADSGQVLAYRNAEPVLVDPGYGPSGYENKGKTQDFTHWEHHNTLCVEEPANAGTYVLPVWPDASRRERVTRAEACRDALGAWRVLEMASPAHRRTVLVADASLLVVVDRLDAARRVKLCWWGNGSAEGRENPGGKLEGDASKVVTARLDLHALAAEYTRGPAFATRIQVVLPCVGEATGVAGEYGPRWYRTNHPLTGLHVTSKDPVRFAVTLVELVERKDGQAPAFGARAETQAGPDGRLSRVLITRGGATVAYVFGDDGRVTRESR